MKVNDEIHRLQQMETEISVLLAESENTRVDGHFAEYMLSVIRSLLVGGPYDRGEATAAPEVCEDE
jgi:hypothetical protein